MRLRKKWMVGACGVIAIALVFFSRRERVYSGHPLSWWLDQTTNTSTSSEFFKSLDTNAVPDLIAILQGDEWRYLPRIRTFVSSHRFLIPSYRWIFGTEDSWLKQVRAMTVLKGMGVSANSALPSVLALMTNKTFQLKETMVPLAINLGLTDEQFASMAPQWIAGPLKRVPAGVLLDLLSSYPKQKMIVANALLDTKSARAEFAVAEDLYLHGFPKEFADELLSRLIPLLNDPNIDVRREVWLFPLVQKSSNTLPILEHQLFDLDPEIVAEGANHIGQFKSLASDSIPRLRLLAGDVNLSVRLAAVNALQAINPANTPGDANNVDLRLEYPLVAVSDTNSSDLPVKTNAPIEKAEISYMFPSLPLQQAVEIYEGLAGKKVSVPASGLPNKTVNVRTPYALTRSQAVQLFEELFRQQAGLEIRHGADGSFLAVFTNLPAPTKKHTAPPGFALPPSRMSHPTNNATPPDSSGENKNG